jgi:hypothetical protein
MESLRKGIEVGATALYVEIRVTKDNEMVAWPSLQRLVNDNPVSLSDHTLNEWRDLTSAFGPPMVSLDEVIELSRVTRTGLFIDMRVSGQENALARKLRTSGIAIENVIVTSPMDLVREILRSLDRRLVIGHRFLNETHAKLTPTLLKDLNADAVIWPQTILSEGITKLLKGAGITVYGGPVLLAQDMRKLRDHCCVDGVVTPYPDLFGSTLHGDQPAFIPAHLSSSEAA